MDFATIIGLIIAIVAVVGVLGIAIWFILTRHIVGKEERLANIEARNKERLALIEKGMDPNLANPGTEKHVSNTPLLIGLILIFACIGRIIAYTSAFNFNNGDKTFIFALPAFFAGLAFLAYHLYQKKISSGKNK
jgi:hypothetical protein